MKEVYEIWKFKKVKYQSWFKGNKMEAGKSYILLSKGSRNEPEGTRHFATFMELDENNYPIEHRVFTADTDWWYTQVSFRNGVKVGEIEKVCKWVVRK